jgi:membrane-associated phospholipid phosphatase
MSNTLQPNLMSHPSFWGALVLLSLTILGHSQLVIPSDVFLTLNSTCVLLLGPEVWPAITLLGDTLVLLCLASPLLLINGRWLLGFIAAIPFGGLASVALKRLFAAPRPFDVLDPSSFHVLGETLHGHSFPSGHSITAFAAAGVAYACLVSKEEKRASHFGILLLVVALATLVGFSRIAVGAHWPIDVMAGACIGWLAGINGVWITQKFPATFQSPKFAWGTLLSLAVCGLFLFFRKYDNPLCQATIQLAATMVWMTLAIRVVRLSPFRYS